jgi:hypothetical protein
MVVTVPEEPRYFNAPDSTYKTPPAVGLAVGAVPLPMCRVLADEVATVVIPISRFSAR